MTASRDGLGMLKMRILGIISLLQYHPTWKADFGFVFSLMYTHNTVLDERGWCCIMTRLPYSQWCWIYAPSIAMTGKLFVFHLAPHFTLADTPWLSLSLVLVCLITKCLSSGTLASFTKCNQEGNAQNTQIKSIVNTEYVVSVGEDPHHFHYKPGYFSVNQNFERVSTNGKFRTLKLAWVAIVQSQIVLHSL